MDVPFLLSEAQMRQIEPFFPLSHGVPRADDRRIVSAFPHSRAGGNLSPALSSVTTAEDGFPPARE
jgi:hypothetical protein